MWCRASLRQHASVALGPWKMLEYTKCIETRIIVNEAAA
jgi:hypothetical protein